MRARLDVQAGDPDHPERATLTLGRALVQGFPRQRPITLALLGFTSHPGLTPTPWALDGLLEACVEAERTPLNLLTLADSDTGEALLRKAGRALLGGADARELVERPSVDRSASLRLTSQRRPFAMPRELIGSSLILCTPLLLRARDQGRRRRWQGPLALALGELARAWGYAFTPPKLSSGLAASLGPRRADDERELAAAGLELIAACFASAAVVIDGTWAGALEPAPVPNPSARPRGPDGRFVRARARSASKSEPPRLLGELASCERGLAVAGLERLELDALLGVDAWLAGALGLPGAAAELPTPSFGETSPGRWPTLDPSPPRGQPARLADRAITGIRTQSRRLASIGTSLVVGDPAARREQPALPARVPGRFASLWTARWYGEHELGGPLRLGPSRRLRPELR